MSKAFAGSDAAPWEPPLILPTTRRLITEPGQAAFLREAKQAREILRPELLRLQAEGQPDAAARLTALDKQLRLHERLLTLIDVARPPPAPFGRPFVGATVTLLREDAGRTEFTLVGPDEVDAAQGKISYLSPLGRALLSTPLGEQGAFNAPRGGPEILFEVVAIERYGAANTP